MIQTSFQLDYANVALVNLIIIYIFYRTKYGNSTEINISFLRVIRFTVIAAVLDIVSSILLEYASRLPMWFNMGINSVYQIFVTCITVSMFYYIFHVCEVGPKYRIFCRIIDGIAIVYSLSYIPNFYHRLYFYFDDQFNYVHGPLHFIIYVIPLFIGILCLFCLLVLNKNFGWKERLYAILIALVILGFVLMQALWFPYILLNIFGISVAMMLFLFLVETPDLKKLRHHIDTLEEDRIRAEAQNEAKSAFLAQMSHEIRTPLNVIVGMNEVIMRETTEANIMEYAADAMSSAKTLQHIISDVLDMSKIESGKLVLAPQEYDFSNFIYDVSSMLNERARKKDLKAKIDVDPNIPNKLYGDDFRLRQIIINLISNACKYTESGSVSFNVTGDQRDDQLFHLRFSVTDTGIGIRKEDIDHLCDSFTRLDEEKNRHIEGTGLGLAITKQILSLMDSDLQIESVYGVGSTFSFEINQEVRSEDKVGNRMWHRREVSKNYKYHVAFVAPEVKILVVDDNSLNRKVVRALLKSTLIQIEEAADGFECLDKVRSTKYDLIFLDHMMPQLDGVETLKRMMDSEHLNKETPVVALTANAIAGAREKYISYGFTDFLTKPVVPAEMEEMITSLLPPECILRADSRNEGEEEELKKKQNAMIDSLMEEIPQIEGVNWDLGKEHFTSLLDLKDSMREFAFSIDREISSLEKLVVYDINDYRIKVHALKSAAALVGMIPISELAKKLEMAAKEEDQTTVEQWNPVLVDELRQMKERLKVLDSSNKSAQVLKTEIINKIEKEEAEEEGIKERKNILIVDDNAMMLRSFKKMLESSYKVMLCTSGKQALHYLEEKQAPDLIVLDYEMPEMNGAEVYQKIKAMDKVKDLPILFLTGVSEGEEVDEIDKLNPAGMLVKPPSETNLRDAIAGIIG